MHLLNQLALDDDFLFDALEGLAYQESNNSKAISDLKTRLKKKKKKRRPLIYWISAAASLLIIVVAVNFISNKTNDTINESLVMEESPVDNIENTADDYAEGEVVIELNEESDKSSPAASAEILKESKIVEEKIDDIVEAEVAVSDFDKDKNISALNKEALDQVVAFEIDEIAVSEPVAAPPAPVTASKPESAATDLEEQSDFAISSKTEPAQRFSAKKRQAAGIEKVQAENSFGFNIKGIYIDSNGNLLPLDQYEIIMNYINGQMNVERRTSLSNSGNFINLELEIDEDFRARNIKVLKGIEKGLDKQIVMLLEKFDQWELYEDELKGKIKLKFEFGG
jgi:hypothetical protein